MDPRPIIIAVICMATMASAMFLPNRQLSRDLPSPVKTSVELFGNETYIWGRCIHIPVLGNCCAEIYAEPTNLTLLISLVINGNVVHTEVLAAGNLCLTQDELLKLISDIPALVPFKPLIDGLIDLLHFIPVDVLNVCLSVYNVSDTPTQFSGCVDLNSTLICWKDSCLYRGVDQFGCFVVPILKAAPFTPSLPASSAKKARKPVTDDV